ncbi:MAG TPA: hypothetical protein VF247_02510 [Candidatus Krumholzibacteria bacterium]
MKAALMLAVGVALAASAARATDHIGIYGDATGNTCTLAAGFSSTGTIIHTSSTGAVESGFTVSVANAPGSTLLGFNSSYQTVCINPPCPFSYGECRTSVVVGTLIATLSSGYIEVVSPTDPSLPPFVIDCNDEVHNAIGGRAYIAGTGECLPLATESSTWGSVKALYR